MMTGLVVNIHTKYLLFSVRPSAAKKDEMAKRTAKERAKAETAADEIRRIEADLARQQNQLVEGGKVVEKAAREEKKLRAMQKQVHTVLVSSIILY